MGAWILFLSSGKGGLDFFGLRQGGLDFFGLRQGGGAIYFIHRNVQTSDPQPVTSEFPKLSSFVGFARKL